MKDLSIGKTVAIGIGIASDIGFYALLCESSLKKPIPIAIPIPILPVKRMDGLGCYP
jgi:N-glycosylase/DNA lyase